TFPVATDSACRNRLLHSRPIDGSEFLPKLWRSGIRGYQVVFNVPGDDVGEIVARYRAMIDALSAGTEPDTAEIRRLLGTSFTACRLAGGWYASRPPFFDDRFCPPRCRGAPVPGPSTASSTPTLDQARAALRDRFGYPAFRPGQEAAVESVLERRDTLVVLP